METSGLLENSERRRKRWLWFNRPSKYHILQVLVAIGGGLSTLAPGMSMGFSAVALPQLRPAGHKITPIAVPLHPRKTPSINGTFPSAESLATTGKLTLTNEEAAWFMSITMATTPLGCLISGFLNDYVGRKGALLAVSAPGLTSWLMLATVPSVAPDGSGYSSVAAFVQMILGRALNGIAIGMAASPGCILAGEASSPSLRGALICINTVSISAGILLVYFLGEVMSDWRLVAAFGGVVTGLVALLTLMLPESPVWLRSRGRNGDADWVCSQLGLRSTVAINGVTSSASGFRKDGGAGKRGSGGTIRIKKHGGINESIRVLMEPQTLRLLLLLSGLFLFQQASGVFVVTFNAIEIASASGIKGAVIDGSVTAVLMGACTFVVVALVCIFIDRWGRRPAAILSGCGMSISMAVLAIYIRMEIQNQRPSPGLSRKFFMTPPNYKNGSIMSSHPTSLGNSSYGGFMEVGNTTLIETSTAISTVSWFPLAALLMWACSTALGFMPLPWAIPAELLPTRSRGIGCGVLSAIAYTFGFIAVRAFAATVIPFGLANCMFVMSAFAAVGAVYVAALLPETKGTILDGLQERGGHWKDVSSSLNRNSSSNTEEDSSDLNA